MSERVEALLGGAPLDGWSRSLCDRAESMTEREAAMFAPRGAVAEGTWAGCVAARLRLQELNPDKYADFDVLRG